ncbi:hypothetical protein [Aquimarina sp. MMG016]|uniref:hypothetical protein n=1 Tax=Aquimarina sp. MMG016 TaxID=2822690 RepID=UPI001B39DAFC|nr:hypothetical protein [Aquimarina sp. MMG016]MBQ4822608.1 hypothetical protein [Aquimarina sp. MMG016]
MKYFKLFLITITLISAFSCSSDDETYDFTGTWKLTSVSSFNYSPDNKEIQVSNQINPSENCLQNEFLIISNDGKATFNSSSELEIYLQLVEGTTDQLEQQVNCIEKESNTIYSWTSGDYVRTNEDGSFSTINSSGFNTITLVDETESTFITVNVLPENESRIIFGSHPNETESHFIEFEGETIEINEIRYLTYERQ